MNNANKPQSFSSIVQFHFLFILKWLIPENVFYVCNMLQPQFREIIFTILAKALGFYAQTHTPNCGKNTLNDMHLSKHEYKILFVFELVDMLLYIVHKHTEQGHQASGKALCLFCRVVVGQNVSPRKKGKIRYRYSWWIR